MSKRIEIGGIYRRKESGNLAQIEQICRSNKTTVSWRKMTGSGPESGTCGVEQWKHDWELVKVPRIEKVGA